MPRRPLGSLANVQNVVAAAWLLILAFVILYDVLGRAIFNSPFPGAREIVGNSVVAILFLQVPLAIHRGNMLRTTLIYDLTGVTGKRLIDIVTVTIGIDPVFGVRNSLIVDAEKHELDEGNRKAPFYTADFDFAMEPA